MQEIQGQLHDGISSKSPAATLQVYPDGTVRLRIEDEPEERFGFDALEIATRLGDTPRKIGLPGRRILETSNNDGVDAILAVHQPSVRGWLHWLENRLALVALAAVFVVAAGGAFVVYGVPSVAKKAAFSVPPELSSKLGSGTLEILDQAFKPTELSEERQAELTAYFDRIAEAAPPDHEYWLAFRGGGAIGANAFALPSGTVVITDELVGLAERDEEIIGVLAHEIGHVVNRHGLRQTIQSSMLAISLVLLTGDLSSASGFVAALPTALAESRFSRDFEREADDYAVDYLGKNEMSAQHFAQMLRRISGDEDEGLSLSFLSSHPSTEERIARLHAGAPPPSSESQP